MKKKVFLKSVFNESRTTSRQESLERVGSQRFRRARGRVLKAAMAVVLVAGAVLVSEAPASAVRPERMTTPVMAGTELIFPGTYPHPCTAGFVVKKNGFWSNLTSYRRAIRYVVTAGHCGNVGDVVDTAGGPIGKVIWKSNISDLMMIRVLPAVARRSHCFVGRYHDVHCSVIQRSEPRAVGKVWTESLRTRGFSPVPISEFRDGVPGDVDRFCTSGATTEVNCQWSRMDVPQGQVRGVGEHGAISDTPVQEGDSGSPVYIPFPTGIICGVVARHVVNTVTHIEYMIYVSAGEFMSETNNRYDLAPS
ncbi:chymotrypsin family serine protease [Leifsonia xyli]|uniref:hypothetical protein n=1 Tax=Leifsonia xyli TaxID=1575 RepID=UPI0011848D3C|nr:hypothetical protein [Leifsonia xyli]